MDKLLSCRHTQSSVHSGCRSQRLAFCTAIMLTFSVAVSSTQRQRPHIVVVTVDDVGMGDVSYSSSDTISLPNIELFIRSGTVLTSMYVAPFAHASRVALNTGRHPATLGNQHEIYDATRPYGVSPEVPLLSERLKARGYVTHAIGQWDLGFYATNLVPTARGFDTFYGSHLPYSSYDTHMGYDEAGNRDYDLHHNVTPDQSPPKLFKVDLYADKAREVIARHNKAKPLYLHVALQAARMYNIESDCAAIPDTYRPRNVHVGDKDRECFLAYLASVDRTFGKIIEALAEKTMLINSVVLFMSLSTGAPAGRHRNSGSNAPLRGQRGTLFEGGLRAPCFLLAPYLGQVRQHYGGLVQVTDWYYTLQAIADYDAAADADYAYDKELPTSESTDEPLMLGGLNQLSCLLGTRHCQHRESMLHYAHGTSGALRKGHLKLIFDSSGSMTSSQGEWYTPVSITHKSRHEPRYEMACSPHRKARDGRSGCGAESHGYYLFNVADDPCEHHNLATCDTSRAELLMLQNMLNASIAKYGRTEQQILEGWGQPTPPRTGAIQTPRGWTPWVSAAPLLHQPRTMGRLAVTLAVAVAAAACSSCHRTAWTLAYRLT